MKNKFILLIYIAIVILAVGATSVCARRTTDPLTTITSVRAMGMGRAGLATMGGSSSLYSNPAGLTKIKNIEASTYSTKLFDEFNYFGMSGAMRLGTEWWGVGYGSMSVDGIPETFRFTQGDGVRNYKLSEYGAGSNFLGVGYATKFMFLGDMSVGIFFKRATEYLEASDDSTFESSSESGIGLDAGMMMPFEFFDRDYEFGLALQNLLAPTFEYEEEDPSSYEMNVRLGISTMFDLWDQNFLVAFDFDNLGIHLGTEWQGPGGVAVRGGLDADNIALGVGLKIFSITGFDNKPHTIAIDYAYRMYETPLQNTNYLGISYLGVSQTEKPTILNPISGKTLSVPTITVEGTAGKGDEVTVYINEIPRKVIRADEKSGIWSAKEVFLSEGKNEIKVQAEQLDFAASEFSEPVMINADLTPVEIRTTIEKMGNEIIVKARASKKMNRVATRLPNNQTLALTYDADNAIWVGTWKVPLKFMDRPITLQTRGVDESGNKTDIMKSKVSVQMVKEPRDRTVTTQDFLNVRGYAPLDAKTVMVGDQILTPNEEGVFETTVALGEIGKQLVEVQVVDAKGVTVSSKVRVLRKASATDVPQDSFAYAAINDLLTIGAIQTDDQNSFRPQDPIKRGELAGLIAKVKGAAPVAGSPFADVPANNPQARAIAAVAQSGWMQPLAEGQFRPEDTVSRGDAVAILLKVNNVPIPEGTPEEVFNDVTLSHPAADVINAAVIAGLIGADQENFYPDEPLSRETAALWFSQTPEAQQDMRELMDWNQGFGLPTEVSGEIPWESQLVVDFADVEWTPEEQSEGLKVISPIDQSTVYDKHAIVRGLVKDEKMVTINGQKIQVDAQGAFIAAIPLDPGPNVIIVEATKEKKMIRIFREASFEDVPKGDVGKNMRLMGSLGYLDTDQAFYPEQTISRRELATVLVRLKEEKPADSSTKISDITADDPQLPWVKRAVDLKYFKLGPNNSFDPGKEVNRGEAIEIINEFEGVQVPGGDLSRKPFADVPVDHKYAKELGAALQAKLIPQTESFYPDTPISREELVDILMNTKVMQEQVNKLLDWDKYDQNKLNAPLKPKKQRKRSLVIDTPSYARGRSAGGSGADGELLGFAPPMERQMKKGMIYPRTADSVGSGAQPLTVLSPKDLLVTDKINVNVAGVVKEKISVLINGKTVAPNAKGAFQTEIGLRPGKNIVNIEAGNNTEKRRVLRLLTYGDIGRVAQKRVIEYLATLGYFAAGSTFQPSKAVARDELATLAVKLAGLRTPAVRQATFSDVPAGYWAAPSIYAAANAGIVEKKTSFKPQESVSRGEAIAVLVRALKKKIPSGRLKSPPLPDVPVDNPYANAIATAMSIDLVPQGSNFKPDAKLTRTELAVWLVKTAPVKKQIIQLRDFKTTS
ncbi:S-layer homology domain-containing protein [Candidatus Margulisiibacteriota bacterium]